jgi:plastocyanin
MKKLIAVFVLLFMITTLVVACGGGSSSGASNEVHMGSTNFVQSSITISKGSSITLVNDMAVTHIISNGMWENGTPKPKQEADAPVVKNMTFSSSGQAQTIGPFNTAGTFHYYCSVHVNMNLTVTVQ